MLRKHLLGLIALLGMTGCCQWCQRHCCQPMTACQAPACCPAPAATAPCCPTPAYGPAPVGYPAVAPQLQRPIPTTTYNYDCCQ